ncbi:hypothetical protein [Leptolyngbya sp. KIOST-1]|uniref:hypothetical protein n=1 Tax=Leptolyngbya sp. KIOST-1 TaxID=1229172 RepID=UPI00068B11BB|nr:hypothetical protein [Leptolyngbya sp. KIOST-1]
MKLHPHLLAASSLLALLSPSAVRADDGVLSFELSPPQWAEPAPAPAAMAPVPVFDPANQPLPIPANAGSPPMRYHSPQQLPAGVYRRGVAVALNSETSATALLPPAPPVVTEAVAVATAPPEPEPEPVTVAKVEPQPLALDFEMEPSPAMVALAEAKLAAAKVPADPLPTLFEGNSNSLVAWAVGSAEGTRTPNGAINPAYFGHTDPGNRVWNMGTFSYQHGAKTPEEADQKQLARLQNQGDVLRQRALKHGLNLTLEETLNGLDLANQSPLAAIGRVGYIERLVEAKTNGYEGAEAILIARTRSYINPNTGRWNAPGLGNTEASIRRDQQRRANAVAQAIAAYESQNPELQAQFWTLSPSAQPPEEPVLALADSRGEPVDDFLRMWTSPSDPVAQVEEGVDETLVSEVSSEVAPGEGRQPLLVASGMLSDSALAHLWRSTVGRVNPSGIEGSVQPESEPIVPAAPSQHLPKDSASQQAQLDHPAPEENPSAAEPAEVAATAEPEVPLEESNAAAPPTWADAREGGQNMPATEENSPGERSVATLAGAVPDSTVYLPETATPEPKASALPSAEHVELPLAGDDSTLTAIADTASLPATPAAPTTNSDAPSIPPASPEAVDQALQVEPAPAEEQMLSSQGRDGVLGFAKVSLTESILEPEADSTSQFSPIPSTGNNSNASIEPPPASNPGTSNSQPEPL